MEVKLTRDVFEQAATADGVLTVSGKAGEVVEAGALAEWLVKTGRAEEEKQPRRKAAAR